MPQGGRASGGFEPRPSNRDFSGSRFGGSRMGPVTMPPQSGRGGGYHFGSSSRGSMPTAAPPRQNPQVSRSVPSYSGSNFNRGMSNAPRSSGSSGGRHNNDTGRGRHNR